MLIYGPGVYLDGGVHGHFLRRMTSDAELAVPEEHVTLAEDLALGSPPDGFPSDLLKTLQDNGWIAEGEDLADPLIREALERLDARFSWAGGATEEGYEALLTAHARRRRLLRSLGQYPALPETGMRRARLAGDEPKDVLLLGDDDLVSIALAKRGHRVVSADADGFLIRYLSAESERQGLNIETHLWDFRLAMPEALLNRFDVVITDPMSSAACLPLFIDRGLSALRAGGKLWVCVNNPAARIFDVHRRETRTTLVTHYSDFNHYYTGLGTLAPYVSDLYCLIKSEAAHAVCPADEDYLRSGLYDEEHFGRRQSTRFAIRDIKLDHTELIHIKALVDEACALGEIEIDDELYHWSEDYRAYIALLRGGRALIINVHADRALCEMLLSPPEAEIERVFQAALMALYLKDGATHTVSRLRNPLATFLP